jgi:hypothetical protein
MWENAAAAEHAELWVLHSIKLQPDWHAPMAIAKARLAFGTPELL